MRSLFFADNLADSVELTGEEGHHAADVVRVKVGEEIDISDGQRLVHARVTSVAKGRVEAEVLADLAVSALTPRITIAQALIKGDAMSQSIDLMTQVGVHEIWPWAAERSIVQWDQSKAEKNLEKMKSLVIEASKQSRRPIPPAVGPIVTTTDLVKRGQEFDRVILLHESGDLHLADEDLSEGRILMVVGPEGGLSDRELTELGGDVRRLGPTVIRSAQAGAIAAAVVFAQRAWRER